TVAATTVTGTRCRISAEFIHTTPFVEQAVGLAGIPPDILREIALVLCKRIFAANMPIEEFAFGYRREQASVSCFRQLGISVGTQGLKHDAECLPDLSVAIRADDAGRHAPTNLLPAARLRDGRD